MEQSYGIAAFRSRQQVLNLENRLRSMGIPGRVVSTPREVALGCGLSVRFDLAHAQAVSQAIEQSGTNNLVGVYRVERQNGRNRLTSLYLRPRGG